MGDDKAFEWALLHAWERAYARGLVEEFANYEAFAAFMLDMGKRPDTPEDMPAARAALAFDNAKAALTFGTGKGREAFIAGEGGEMAYFFAVVPPVGHLKPEDFYVVTSGEADARILFCVVEEDVESRLAASPRALTRRLQRAHSA